MTATLSAESVPDPVVERFEAEQLRRLSHLKLRRLGILGTQIGITAAVLGLWELVIRLGVANPLFVGRPAKVMEILWTNTWNGTFPRQAIPTFQAVLLAFVLATVVGITAGIVLHELKFLDQVFEPLLALLNSIPRIALAPMMIVWFGLGLASKTALAFSLIVFIIIVSTMGALKNVDDYLILLGRSLGAKRWQTFRYIKVPWATPGIFAGLRLGLVYSVLSVVVAEMMASPDGLGQLIAFYSNRFDVSAALAALLFLSLLTLALNAVITKTERRIGTWEADA